MNRLTGFVALVTNIGFAPTAYSDVEKYIDWSIQASNDARFVEGADPSVSSGDFDVSVTLKFTEGFKMVGTGNFDRFWIQDGDKASSNPDHQYFKELYIQIGEIGKQKVAFFFGLMEMPVGQDVNKMPDYTNTPGRTALWQEDRLIGAALFLNAEEIKILDTLELSVFDSKRYADDELYDGLIGNAEDLYDGSENGTKLDSFSARVTKRLYDELKLTASYMTKGHHAKPSPDREHRVNVGLIYQNQKGWTIWFEAAYLDDHPRVKSLGTDTHVAFTGGAAYQVNEKTEVVGEVTHIQDLFTEVGVGVSYQLNQHLRIGPSVRYRMYEGGEDFLQAGVNLSTYWGKAKQRIPQANPTKTRYELMKN